MKAKEFFSNIKEEVLLYRQYHEVMSALYKALLEDGATDIIYNLKNTSGTGVLGIDETISRLKENGLHVERMQDRLVDYSHGIKMLMQTTIRVGFEPLPSVKSVGSITDPAINDPLPAHMQHKLSYA